MEIYKVINEPLRIGPKSASDMNNLDSRHDTAQMQQSSLQSPTSAHRTHSPSMPFGSQQPFRGAGAIQSDMNDVGNSAQRQHSMQKPSFPPGFGPQQTPMTDISDGLNKLQLSPPIANHGRPPMSSQGTGISGLMMPQVSKDESGKDIRAEAQDFFGNFLKQAAAHQQPEEKPKASSSAPFNDPAIMAARVASPPNSQPKFSEPMQSPIHTHQYRPSPPMPQNQVQDPRNHQMDRQGYQKQPAMFSPPPGLMPSMMQPPYMFRNNMSGPPGMPPSYMHGPPQPFPMLPPDMRMPPPGMSPEEHHHRLEQFMRAKNPGSSL
ncbi:hypothetical protein BC943DRAFT_163972 [Umbelopsis sp. AD052]|nr:hypothetical protein BC943DRAFT_163972 [Umbelopsis sp. AD052]